MAVKTGFGFKAARLANNIVNMAVITAILLAFIFGCYAIWDTRQIYHAADAARYATYKPAPGSLSFNELQAINPEALYWLNVYGTNIDYPVTQGGDNMKYVNTDAKGRYSLSGAIFLDYRNSPDFIDFSNILYGHHMDKQTMFGEIGLFSDKEYFDARKYGSLYYGGREHGLEFFAFVHADAYDNSIFRTGVTGLAVQQAYLDMLRKTAIHLRGDVPVTPESRIVLLSTCSSNSTNGRDILIGMITDNVYDNPFEVGKNEAPGIIAGMEKFPGLWARVTPWLKIVMASQLLLIILLSGHMIYQRKTGCKAGKEMN